MQCHLIASACVQQPHPPPARRSVGLGAAAEHTPGRAVCAAPRLGVLAQVPRPIAIASLTAMRRYYR
jgi:hypothetical protein